MDRIGQGRLAEDAAELFLQQHGCQTLQRNFRCRLGEIDLVMRDGDCLVFAEVRFRQPGRFGNGAESITQAKRQKLIRSAGYYLRTKKISSHQVCRFDVLSVGQTKAMENSDYSIDWIRSAFRADG